MFTLSSLLSFHFTAVRLCESAAPGRLFPYFDVISVAGFKRISQHFIHLASSANIYIAKQMLLNS